MERDEMLKAVVDALEDPKFKWRTIDGISNQTGLNEKEVLEAITELRKRGKVIRSADPSETGDDLFTTREHYKRFAPLTERLGAVLRNRAS